MGKLSQVKANLQAETEGIWVTFSHDMDFLIGKVGTPQYKAYLRKLSKPFASKLQARDPDGDLIADLVNKTCARYVLLNWKNVDDDEGNPIPYSEDAAYKLLSDPEYHVFREWVLEVGQNDALYSQQLDEEIAGN